MHLLDTDTLSHLHAGNPRVDERLERLDDPDVGTTVITLVELLRGRMDFVLKAASGAQLLVAQQRLLRTQELLEQVAIVYFDKSAAAHFDRLRAVSAFRKIGRADLLIASIALSQQGILVTRNTRHFRQIPGVAVVNWVD